MTFRSLISGLDTVQVAYYLQITRDAAFSFEALTLEKEKLRAAKGIRCQPIEIGGKSFMLQKSGSSSGYPLVFENGEYRIECGEFNVPSFFVTFTSQALWHRGAQALHDGFLAWARSAGLVAVKAETLSRVDFAFDYWIPSADFGPDSVVSLSAKDSHYRENRTVQTITYGKGDVVLRIYDKIAEIEQQSGKVWLFKLWGVQENVWRIEWQVRKKVLRRFGIRTFDDLFSGRGDVLRYLASEHDSLRVPTADSNRSRWPLHPLWADLLEQVQRLECQGVWREIDAPAALNERLTRIGIAVYGYVKRLAAIMELQRGQGEVGLPTALECLNGLVRKVHDPLSWKVDVRAKRDHTRLEYLP